MPPWLSMVLPYVVPALITAAGLWFINRRKPALDAAQAATLRKQITAGNGVERAELSRVVSEAAAEMITAQRSQAKAFADEAVANAKEIAVLKSTALGLEKQLKDQNARFEGEMFAERARLGTELDVERKARMKVAADLVAANAQSTADLTAANARIAELEREVGELKAEKGALHRDLERFKLKAVPPAKP